MQGPISDFGKKFKILLATDGSTCAAVLAGPADGSTCAAVLAGPADGSTCAAVLAGPADGSMLSSRAPQHFPYGVQFEKKYIIVLRVSLYTLESPCK